MGIISGGGGEGSLTPPVTLTGDGSAGPVLTLHNTDPGGSDAFEVVNADSVTVAAVATSNAANTSDEVSFHVPTAITLGSVYAGFDVLQLNGANGGFVRFTDNGASVDVTIATLPAADPHVAGQLWNSAGVVHVSAG